MDEDKDTILINDCKCGCHCGEVELHSDHQPEVLLVDEQCEKYENNIVRILELINEIKDIYGGASSEVVYEALYAEKEVINVMTASSAAPSSPSEGNYYINIEENKLYQYDGSVWKVAEQSGSVVYIASDNTHVWLWNGTEFVDVTGQEVDNTIYVNDLKEGLKPYTDDGIYKVCYTTNSGSTVTTKWYTMTVTHQTPTTMSYSTQSYTTQILQDKDGYAIRNATYYASTGNTSWGAWQWYKYAFEGRNAKKAQLELSFHNSLYVQGNDNANGGEIYVRDKNNVIEDGDYLVLYYWNRKKRRITAFAGGTGIQKIYPIRWGNIASTSMRKEKGWKDDWRKLPYTISDIMKRITDLTESQMSDLTWDGGLLKGTLLGDISFVGGVRGNSFSTKLWIGVAKKLSYSGGGANDTHVHHFRIGELVHRMPFYIRCFHKPYGDSKGYVFYQGSLSRKPHINFKGELSSWW